MDRTDLDLLEFWVDLNAGKKAQELGVKYQVRAKLKESCLDVLVRIQQGHPNNGVFAEFIGDLICDKYRCDVRYSYPSRI